MELYHWQALALAYGFWAFCDIWRVDHQRLRPQLNLLYSAIAWIIYGAITIGVVEIIRGMWLWLR